MKRSYIVLFHIVFWMPYFFQCFSSLYVFFTARLPIVSSKSFDVKRFYEFALISNTISLAGNIFIFYLFYLYLFPRFLTNQKLKEFVIYGLLASLGVGLVSFVSSHYFAIEYRSIKYSYMVYITYINDVMFFFKLAALGVTACMLKGFIGWYNDIRYKKELENRNLHTELALLKAQINPHFLFNTLNNIDILIEKNAPAASVYLKKLSDLLRFTLYESPAGTVPLEREIAGIGQFIELQKIRTANPNFVKFDIHGDIDGLFIAPMLFMPFIENAFKHSTNKKVDCAIDITMTITHREIIFSCINVFDEAATQLQPNSGLGLELIRNRLNLFYQGNHNLIIDKENELFKVQLTINADDN